MEPPHKALPIKFIGLSMFLLYCIFAVWYQVRHYRESQEAVREHGRMISGSLWNLDNKGPAEYLKEVAFQYDYERLVVTDENNRIFYQLSRPRTSALDNALIRTNLIPLKAIRAPINYKDKTIGTISVIWRNKSLYVYLYVLLITVLLYCVFYLYYRVLSAKNILEQQVKQRTQELRHAYESLKENEEFLSAVVENIPDMIFIKDAHELRFIKFNKAGEELLGYSREELIGKNDYDFFPKQEADFFTAKDREVISSGNLLDIPEESLQTRHKGERTLHTKKIPLYDKAGKPQYLLGISEDITERIKAQKEQARLRKEVQESLADIKTLRGLLPICSSCKKIRDDQGYWNQIEGYLTTHSEVSFSHSLCPDCIRTLYSGQEWYKDGNDDGDKHK